MSRDTFPCVVCGADVTRHFLLCCVWCGCHASLSLVLCVVRMSHDTFSCAVCGADVTRHFLLCCVWCGCHASLSLVLCVVRMSRDTFPFELQLCARVWCRCYAPLSPASAARCPSRPWAAETPPPGSAAARSVEPTQTRPGPGRVQLLSRCWCYSVLWMVSILDQVDSSTIYYNYMAHRSVHLSWKSFTLQPTPTPLLIALGKEERGLELGTIGLVPTLSLRICASRSSCSNLILYSSRAVEEANKRQVTN